MHQERQYRHHRGNDFRAPARPNGREASAGRSVSLLLAGIVSLVVGVGLPPGLPAGTPEVPLTLPVVARPPAEQPPVGLKSDTHLDKTPPRQTIGLDLIRNGWTYNCMECHTLLAAK